MADGVVTGVGDPDEVQAPGAPRDGRVRVVIGHRSAFLRDGLLLALGPAVGVHVVGVAEQPSELAELVERQRPHVTLTEPDLRGAGPLPGLIVMVDTLEDGRISEFYASGAQCVVSGAVGREELVGLLHRVAAGHRVVLDATQQRLAQPEGEVVTERYGPRAGGGEGRSPRVGGDVREGLLAAALARTLVAVTALAAVLGELAGLPHPAASWALVALLALWAAASAGFVRRPPRLPAWVGIGVDGVLCTGLGVAFADLRAVGVPLGVLLVTFALRAAPRTVAGVALLAVAELVLFAATLPPDGAFARVVIFAIVALVAVMVAISRLRGEEQLKELIVARRELLAEALSAEVRARRQIAEELHDDPLQLLLAAGQELHERHEDPEAVDRAAELVAQASVCLRTVMQRSATARPVPGRLRESLGELCEHQARRGGYTWTVAVGPGIDTVLHELLYGLAAELVGNVTKHAQASRLALRVRQTERGAELVVQDDGTGVAAGRLEAAAEQGHLGMGAVRRRVAAAEGTLDIDSSPERGTAIRVWLPSPVRR